MSAAWVAIGIALVAVWQLADIAQAIRDLTTQLCDALDEVDE